MRFKIKYLSKEDSKKEWEQLLTVFKEILK